MSRLDYFTITVVAICILAIIFLLYKTSNLLGGNDDTKSELEKTLQEMGIDENAADTSDVFDPMTTDTPDTTASYPYEDEAYYSEDEATSPTSSSTPKPENFQNKPSAEGDYLVVAGSFRYKHNAENEAERLRSMGYETASIEIFNKGVYATLVVDRFSNDAAASQLVEELKRKNIPAYVHKVRPLR